MSDIVERLRNTPSDTSEVLMDEAADEIERLKALLRPLARCHAPLEDVQRGVLTGPCGRCVGCKAREALDE